MRVGISPGALTATGTTNLSELVAEFRAAAEAGFHTVWCSQMFGMDALTVLAIAGHEIADVRLGTAVLPIYPRHPLALASQALTVQAAVANRLTLGVGTSHPMITEDLFGYSFDRPGRHTRDYLSVLGPLLRGEPVTQREGTVHAVGSITVDNAEAPSLLLAALGPRMLRIAGELTDGTVTWMTGPKTMAEHIVPRITKAAAEAGRVAPRVVAGVIVCVTSDEPGARARVAEQFAMASDAPSYRAVLDREGARGPEDVAVVGDERSVEEQIRRLSDAGATEVLAAPFGTASERARTFELLASHAPGL